MIALDNLQVSERQNAQKETLLLINKADLISEYQRKVWAEYFEQEGIDFIFFSAVEEQEKLEDDIENLKKEEDIEDHPEEKEVNSSLFCRKETFLDRSARK